MANPGHKQHSGVSRSRLIVMLLALVSILVLLLVWQAVQTAGSNRVTSTRVLQDYARLAGDEFIRRSMVQVGYYGYYAHLNALRRQHAAGVNILAAPNAAGADDAAQKAAELAKNHFYVERSEGGLRSAQQLDATVQGFLARRAGEILAEPSPDSELTIEHQVLDGRAHTFVFSSEDDALLGFEVDRSVLGQRLREVFDGDPLLPVSLGDGSVGNQSLYLRFGDESGEVLFASKDAYDPYLLTTMVVDDEYSGIFLAHSLAVAIDAGAADALIIGGLPRSRLPLLLVTVLLTIALLIAAILQLRREYALMKMRSDFVSEVSHELRTPLTQIRMFTETLLLERFETPDDKRRALGIINRESQRLIHLVENVLRFSGRDGEAQPLSVTHGSLASTIELIVDEFRPLADAAGNTIELDLDDDTESAFDIDALRRILLNLLDNAVKYGPENQRLRVTLQPSAKGARLAVCDQGPGVPPADREKIWDGYYRLERERDSAIAGTGIGLAVVRDLVTRLGGDVRVEAGDDGGASFVVELPATAVQS